MISLDNIFVFWAILLCNNGKLSVVCGWFMVHCLRFFLGDLYIYPCGGQYVCGRGLGSYLVDYCHFSTNVTALLEYLDPKMCKDLIHTVDKGGVTPTIQLLFSRVFPRFCKGGFQI